MFREFIEILILSVVQGVSEFLPISSSAHLILVSKIYDFKTIPFNHSRYANIKIYLF